MRYTAKKNLFVAILFEEKWVTHPTVPRFDSHRSQLYCTQSRTKLGLESYVLLPRPHPSRLVRISQGCRKENRVALLGGMFVHYSSISLWRDAAPGGWICHRGL